MKFRTLFNKAAVPFERLYRHLKDAEHKYHVFLIFVDGYKEALADMYGKRIEDIPDEKDDEEGEP
jgi:hypothetical protein